MVSVALIGWSGFIGSNLARFLISCGGYEVRSFDLDENKLRLRFENNHYSFDRLDVWKSASEVDHVIAEADVVVNLAAKVRSGMFLLKPLEIIDVNFFPSIAIIKSCMRQKNSFGIFPLARFTARPAEIPRRSGRTRRIAYSAPSPTIVGSIRTQSSCRPHHPRLRPDRRSGYNRQAIQYSRSAALDRGKQPSRPGQLHVCLDL